MECSRMMPGWADGKIRAFTPETGKLKFLINDAHVGGVSAIACSFDNTRIVSGGTDGQVCSRMF